MNRNNKPARIIKGTAKQPTLKDASGVWTLDEAMQAHRANTWPQPDLFQPVSNSLRLKTASSTALVKQVGRSGNQRTWTWSGWVKRGLVDLNYHSFFCGGNASDYIAFWNDNSLVVSNFNGTAYIVRTTQLFRDPSAWYHLVITMDTTQATSSNRIKIYVNGSQVTSFAESTYPSQNYTTKFNASTVQYLGYNEYNYFDGQLGEVNFVDGYALQPTLFGKFDTNNTWVPIPYTGTYGTTGFYLPFTNPQTSQTLGYDASFNGTTAYDADQDPYRGHVALHLTGNGPVGGQNNTFTDSGPYQFAITRSGSTITQGSFSPFPLLSNTPYNPAVHGGSAYFNDTLGDYLLVATNYYNNNNIGSGAFTLECWAWIKSGKTGGTGNGASIIMSQGNNASNLMWSLQVNFAGTQLIWGYTGASASVTTTIPLDSWVHFAITRDASNSEKIFVNGALVNTRSNTQNYSSVARYEIQLGCGYDTNYPAAYGVSSYANTFSGYLSSTRLIVGTAVYTAAFTPTNRPFGTLTNNLITFSEDFSNASWTIDGTGATSVFNAGVAPDGTPSATLAREGTSASGGARTILTSPWSTLSATTFTFSMYVKNYGQKRNVFMLAQESANAFYAHFDIVAGTVVNASNSGTGTYTGSGITDAGNGWFRIWITGSITSSAIYTMVTGEAVGTTGFTAGAYTGDGSSGYLVWGAQLETASSPSNYTPTPANFRTAPSLLLNFANAAVVDSTGSQNLLTASGATITSASKYGSGSLSFNGTSDYLQSPATGLNAFGTADFTIEAWINFNSVANGQIVSAGTGGQANAYYWQYYSSQLQFGVQSVGSVTVVNWTPTANIWYHVCVMRQGTNYYQFVNGQQISVATYSQSWVDGPTYIGYGGAGYFNGKMDDVRITRGVARYSFSGFTPPVRALPETGGKSFTTVNVNAGVVQRFTTTGTTSWTAPSDVTSVEVLVVAGGGGSGGVGLRSGMANTSAWGGGGGGGGLIYNSRYPVTPGQTYTVTVGAGGAVDTNGGNSVFGNLTAIGGGAGGDSSNGAAGDPGNAGGSGGGGGGDIATAGGAGTAGQGFAGGAGQDPAPEAGGGGGGAGGAGVAGTSTSAGGVGLQFGISGTPTYYAGGGGGGCGTSTKTTNIGGLGGGGNGTTNPYTGASTATAGTANTGGGGGGGPTAGGSGIVLIRYTTTAVGNISDATTDNLVDSPTQYGHDYGNGGEVVGNYATLNILSSTYGQTLPTLSNGNLTYSGVSAYTNADGSIAITSGTFYYEVTLAGTVSDASAYLMGVNSPGGYFRTAGIRGNGIVSGLTITTGSTFSYGVGDVIGMAFNYDTTVITYFKNGAQQCTTTNNSGAFTRPMAPWIQSGGNASVVFHCNFGQRPWAYAPPAGYGALTTKNLPRLTNAAAIAPNQYFDTVLYTGTGSARSVSGFNFEPDLLWVKDRSTSAYHRLFDRVRGVTNSPGLYSNATSAEAADNLTFTSTGFSYTTDPYSTGMNVNGNSHVVWGWKAGGAAVANTAGTVTSQVSANTTSGFSIVTYTGTGATATVGHGLGTTPAMTIIKRRDATQFWIVWHQNLAGYNYNLYLQDTANAQPDGQFTALPSSTVMSLNASGGSVNVASATYVAYCWAEVPGFSKFGSYTGNGSTTAGPFIYCGFRPRFVMIKDSTNTATQWHMIDSARNAFNPADARLMANLANAENAQSLVDFTSTGFKIRDPNGVINTSAATLIFMAFAEKPFGNVNGTAR